MKLIKPCRLGIFGFVLLIASQALAQEYAPAKKLDALFDLLESNDKFMGSVAVSRDGRILFQKQCGSLAKKETAKSNSETQYRIGSITKTFTAVMIMQLVEEELLSLDAKLSKFYPNLANADQITMAQMLGHRSGIGSITDDPTYGQWKNNKSTRDEMMKLIAKQPSRFEPGSQTAYSNSNFVLLGYIIEDLTKSTYADQLQSRICKKIGLQRTAYATEPDTNANVATSFRWSGDGWQEVDQTDPSIPHGAGAIMSTPSDLTRFVESLFAGKLVSMESLSQMTPAGVGMGKGLIGFPFGPKVAFGHGGGIDGFQSNLGYFKDDKIAVAIVGNGLNYDLNEVMIGILSIVFERPYTLPTFAEVDVSAEKLKRFEGAYAREKFPLKITVTVKDNRLVGQATGQSAFTLTATSETDFKFDPAGIAMSFTESKAGSGYDTLMLKQGGVDLEFRKE